MDVICTPFDVRRLTPRQYEIVCLARKGYGTDALVATLRITPTTLRWHVSQIRQVLPDFEIPDTTEEHLTTREQEVALLLAAGFSNNAISTHLTVSLSTVAYHIAQLYRKTGAQNRVQLAQVARSPAFPTVAGIALAEG